MRKARHGVKLADDQIKIVENWYRALRALGSQKQLAARLNVPSIRIRRIVQRMLDKEAYRIEG